MPFAPIQSIDRAAGRLRAALIDPKRADRAVLGALAVYVLIWALYGAIAKGPQGLHPDMTEVIAWSRDLSLGYLKHPPLAAWLVAAWFALFPVAGCSYYLLAMLMPGLALWLVWRLSADYLNVEKRVVALALLTFVPFFNFHALKFNVNTVLIPLWAATAFCFLRSYRTRSAVWAALAGLAAAGAMLGKYWSVFLLAGLFLAALIDARRSVYFKSPAPYITALVGLVALSPHLYWLVQNNFAPFTYAMIVHGEKPFATTALSALGYLGGSLAYVAVPIIVAGVLYLRSSPRKRGPRDANAKPEAQALDPRFRGDDRGGSDDDCRLLALAFWLPLLLPALGAVIGKSEITSLWSMPAFALLTILLLSPEIVAVRAIDTRRILIAAVAVPTVMLIASPVIAVIAQRNGPQPASAQAELLAQSVERAWRVMTPQPLRYVGGDADLAYAVVSFASGRPRALTDMPPPPAADLARAGQAIVCFGEDAACRRKAEATGGPVIVSDIVRNVWRIAGKPQRYVIVLVPPGR